ncbi:hypothetical protein EZJ49_14325 [Bdellovibrio bacteriovorus]|uniref:hypothetical protein n=1 Tax=Bdellovibrio bacteriovorus TaxID=959 RepID=UPI0021CF3180|nr:hypothetical protein [Bdellovibrio bacteriovorus]UXR64240.1 hypothetical protein EZJ49_14325 [Bdellovibrio bacteriovorus]
MATRLLNVTIFIAVLFSGLLAGFVTFFVTVVNPTLREMRLRQYIEFYQVAVPIFEPRVKMLYILMIISTSLWLLLRFRYWKSFEAICIAGALFCTLDEIILSYWGHYKLNEILYRVNPSDPEPLFWMSIRNEWIQFMYLHMIVTVAGFVLILMALYFNRQMMEQKTKSQ